MLRFVVVCPFSRPDGATECSHGWSVGPRRGPTRNPWKVGAEPAHSFFFRPGGAKESRCPHLIPDSPVHRLLDQGFHGLRCAPPVATIRRPVGAGAKETHLSRGYPPVSTGCAALHPWLQSSAPLGRVRRLQRPLIPCIPLARGVTYRHAKETESSAARRGPRRRQTLRAPRHPRPQEDRLLLLPLRLAREARFGQGIPLADTGTPCYCLT